MSRSQAFTISELTGAPKAVFGHPTDIRFQDVDGAAIVFYSRFFEYFHDAYAAFLRHHGISLAEAVRSGEWLAPLAHAEAEYVHPLKFGDSAVVEIVRARIGTSSLRVGYRIVLAGTSTVCTVGQTVHVMVDRETFRPMPVPEPVRRAFATIP
jgi:YbgC/YbaW family acyl-CoA thioester hydrolase